MATTAAVDVVKNQDPLYESFHGAGFSPRLLLFYTPQFVFASIAIMFNCSLIAVTMRTKSLHNTCNLLIALDSAGSVLLELYHLTPFFIALSGQNYISSMTCFWLYALNVVGVNTTLPAMFYISVERLVGIVFPIWVSQMRTRTAKILLWSSVALSMPIALYHTCLYYQGVANDFQNEEVRCHNGDIRVAWVKEITFRNNLTLLGMTTTTYLTIWFLMIRSKLKKLQFASTYNMHIIKGLSVIMALLLVGWILNGTSLYYLPLFKLDPIQKLVAGVILASFTIIASGGNAPILYTFSTEYRRSFRAHFKWLFKSSAGAVNSIAVFPVGTTLNNINNMRNIYY